MGVTAAVWPGPGEAGGSTISACSGGTAELGDDSEGCCGSAVLALSLQGATPALCPAVASYMTNSDREGLTNCSGVLPGGQKSRRYLVTQV